VGSQGACELPGSSMGPGGSGGFGLPSHGALAPRLEPGPGYASVPCPLCSTEGCSTYSAILQ